MGRGALARKFDNLTSGFSADAARSATLPARGDTALRGPRRGFAP